MSDPFAERPRPWWRRIWRRDGADGVPRRYAVPASAVGPIVALTTNTHGMNIVTKLVLGFALFVALPALVEIWWKQRRRRDGERLLVLPDGGSDRPPTIS
jgi:hypothetical protein